MKPVASKVLKELRKDLRGSMASVAAACQAVELAKAIQTRSSLPPNHEAWMRAFKLLGTAASALLGVHALRKLGARIDAAEEEYMPGGPPMSPLLDSVFISWWMADLGTGPMHESLCSILAEIGPMIGLPPELVRCARVLDESRLGVYRVTDLGGERVQLAELTTGARVTAHVPDDLRSRGPLWLTRVLPPLIASEPDWVVWTTPYLLEGPAVEGEWQAYCERAIAAAGSVGTSEALAQHFKAKSMPQRFLEYIMDGYGGVSAVGEIVLLGVPDRPETLPHNSAYQENGEAEATPLQRVREQLLRLAGAEPAREQAPNKPKDQDLGHLHDLLNKAFRMYGQTDERGQTAVDRLLRDAASLPTDEQAALNALAAGWFSVFEIKRVRVDEALELRDLLNARSLTVSERIATRQVGIGDLIAGWVMVEGERVTLEGATCHVPAGLAEGFMREVKAARSALGRKHKSLRSDKRDALLVPQLASMLEASLESVPPPRIVNRDGDDVLFSMARYKVVRAEKVDAVLDARFKRSPDGSYAHVVDGVVAAHIVRSGGDMLRIECDSRRRLKKAKELLRGLLGSTIEHIADEYEDPTSHAALEARPRTPVKVEALPSEAASAISAMMVDRMLAWLDEPVPMLKGKTPRAAVRTKDGRDDVIHLLTRQQQIFAAQSSLPPIDLSPIWAELDLAPR